MKKKKKLTICYLIWNTKKCGGNKVVFEHANRLQERGHLVKIFSVLGGKVDWFELKVRLESFLKLGFFKKTDVAVATFWPTAYLAMLARTRKKFYFVLGWEPDYYRNPLLSFATSLTYKYPFCFIAISKFLKEKIEALSPKSGIFVVPLAVDTDLFKPEIKGRERQVGQKKKKKIRILSVVSSYQLYKGTDRLVRLIKKLKEINPAKYWFVLVSFEKEPYSSVFDEFISRASDERLVKEYQNADVFLATPRVEGFFLPGLEAMACGCPVAMVDSGGVREYAKDNINCLMAQNVEEIIKKELIEKIVKDETLRKRLTGNGLRTAKKMSSQELINKLEKILFYGKKI